MRSIGNFLLIFGLLSVALKLFFPGVYFLLLIWIDNWGSDIGWVIRIAMVVAGAVLTGLSMRRPAPSTDSVQPPGPPRI